MKKLILFSFVTLFLSSSQFAQDSKDWSIVASYPIYGKASGLAWDGSSTIYYGIYGTNGDKVYNFNTASGATNLQFSNPAIDDSYGATWDGQNIWIIDQPASSNDPALATKLDLSGNIISTITLPDHYMSGIAYDNGDFWVCTYYPDPGTIYKINSSGTILTQFQSPGEQPWDICLENGDLWVADYYDDMLYKIDMSGTILESHPADNIKPSGIVYDGNYLWYCDGQISTSPSTLYKVDLGGAGTPEIDVPQTEHDYGVVTIGGNPVWNMSVSNTGTAPLTITNILIPSGEPVSTPFNTPALINPGNSVTVPLYYIPVEPIPLDVTIEVVSDDPVTPSVDVELYGHGVNDGPSAQTFTTEHNFGDVRVDAHTRWYFMVRNLGDETLEISNISADLPEYYYFQDDPATIEVGTIDTAMIGLWFNPGFPFLYEGTVSMGTNDPLNAELVANLSGMGLKTGWEMGEELWHYNIDAPIFGNIRAIEAINDITYDSVAEVIVCCEDNFVRCFNGNAHGIGDVIWEHFVYSGSVQGQTSLDIADINNDGEDEVIIGTTGGDRAIRVFNGKTGELIWVHTTSYGDGGWVYQVNASFDYNDDGNIDVLASAGDDAAGTGPNRVYCLDGLTGDPIWECPTGGPMFACVGVKDFNGDGTPDAIGGGSDAGETEGKVFGIDGSSGAILWTFTTPTLSVWALEVLDDVNGKGVEEIIAGDFGGHVYIIDPEDGSELHSTTAGNEIILRFEKLDDVNGDGYDDVLLAYSGTNGVVLSGLDLSTVWFWGLADKAWVVDRIGDVSGDSLNDVIIGTLFNNTYCYFMDGASGDELLSIPFYSPLDAIGAIPDIVGDFSMEMVAGGRNGEIYCYSGGLNTATNIGTDYIVEGSIAASCYPNPIQAGSGVPAKINYSLPDNMHITISIYDIRGRMVNKLDDAFRNKGIHKVEWNGTANNGRMLPSGLYFCRIASGKGSTTLKISILN